jgi:hypothetical protein
MCIAENVGNNKKMRIIKLTFLLIIIIYCKQNKEVKETDQLRTEQQSEVLLEKANDLYPNFKIL